MIRPSLHLYWAWTSLTCRAPGHELEGTIEMQTPEHHVRAFIGVSNRHFTKVVGRGFEIFVGAHDARWAPDCT